MILKYSLRNIFGFAPLWSGVLTAIALEEKIKVLEGRVKEPLSVSGLNSQIATVLNKQEAISKKIEKYEAYIQSKMKKN